MSAPPGGPCGDQRLPSCAFAGFSLATDFCSSDRIAAAASRNPAHSANLAGAPYDCATHVRRCTRRAPRGCRDQPYDRPTPQPPHHSDSQLRGPTGSAGDRAGARREQRRPSRTSMVMPFSRGCIRHPRAVILLAQSDISNGFLRLRFKRGPTEEHYRRSRRQVTAAVSPCALALTAIRSVMAGTPSRANTFRQRHGGGNGARLIECRQTSRRPPGRTDPR